MQIYPHTGYDLSLPPMTFPRKVSGKVWQFLFLTTKRIPIWPSLPQLVPQGSLCLTEPFTVLPIEWKGKQYRIRIKGMRLE